MKKKEIFTFIAALTILALVLPAGNPGERDSAGVIGVRAEEPTGSVSPSADPASKENVTSEPKATATPVPTATATPAPTATATPTPKATATPTPKVTATPAPTATPTPYVPPVLSHLVVIYNGGSVVVGEKYDIEQLKIYAYWTNGAVEEIAPEDCDISGDTVEKQGYNKFVVVYKGMTDSFSVTGKTLVSIGLDTTKYVYGLFNGIDERYVSVTAFYNDGSAEQLESGYIVSPAAFKVSGVQDVDIFYKNCRTMMQVYVNEAKTIRTLSVSYDGKDPIQDQEISRSDITVTAIYDDGSFSTERITTYEIAQTSFPTAGENTLTVSFMGKIASCKINVEARKIVEMKAEYAGDPVEIGQVYSDRELHVYLIYNDGLEEEINNYSVYDSVIRYLGDNTIRIYYGDYNTSVKITGIEVQPPDFDYVSDFTIRSGNNSFTITTAIPKSLTADCLAGKLIKKTKLTKAFRKLNSKNGWFCGFGFDFTDPEYETHLPMTVRITLPEDMEPEYTEVYFTPNLKSIVAKMNKLEYDEHTLEITMFKVGSYMIVYDPDAYAEEEVEEDTSEE